MPALVPRRNKYWPQKKFMYVKKRATPTLIISTFKLRIEFKV